MQVSFGCLQTSEELLQREMQECRRIVREGREAIRRLADALLEKSFLTGEEIGEVFFRGKPVVYCHPAGK